MELDQDRALLAAERELRERDRQPIGPEHAGIGGFAQLAPKTDIRRRDHVRRRTVLAADPCLGLLETVSNVSVEMAEPVVAMPDRPVRVGEDEGDPVPEAHLDLGQGHRQGRPDILVPGIEPQRLAGMTTRPAEVPRQPFRGEHLDDALGPGRRTVGMT